MTIAKTSYFIVILFFSGNVHAEALENVLIISVDALHPAAISKKTTPAIFREISKGAYTRKGKSTEPPQTLISHTAMFTGLNPKGSGKKDNQWQFGQPNIAKETIFNDAKRRGYRTGYFFSKEKLGYLVNSAVDVHQWSRDDAIGLAMAFIKKTGRRFVFVHVGGLDLVGPRYGWLSAEYMEELFYIDDYLSSIFKILKQKQNYLVIITSDHAGHGKIHGSHHPEDYKLPFVISSDSVDLNAFQNMAYSVVDMKAILNRILGIARSEIIGNHTK